MNNPSWDGRAHRNRFLQVFAALFGILFSLLPATGQTTSPAVLRVHTPPGYDALVQYLNSHVHGFRFEHRTLSPEQLRTAAIRREVEFALTPPGQFVELEMIAGARLLATMRAQAGPSEHTTLVGAAVLVPTASPDVPTQLRDLRGKRIAVVEPPALAGWLGVARELRSLGIDADGAVHHSVLKTAADVVAAVRRGDYDAGVVATGEFERLAAAGVARTEEFRILPPLEEYPEAVGFPFQHSTHLYPQGAFAALPHVSETAARSVAIALLRLSQNGQEVRTAAGTLWSLPMSYQSVHRAMAELRMGPYQDAGRISWMAILREYSGRALLLLACVIGMLLVVVLRISRLNRELGHAQDELRREFGLRMQAQERRLASEVRFHHLFNQSAAGICMTNTEGRLVEANPAMCTMLGYAERELALTGVEQLTHPEDAAAETALMGELRSGKRQSYTLEKRLRHRDGAYIWVHFTASRMILPVDGVVLEIGVADNITESKQAEAERERLIAELQSAMAEVKTLSGLLPICASCKKIRDDHGYWKQVEEYLQDKTDVRFTHGICPACFSRLYPEYE